MSALREKPHPDSDYLVLYAALWTDLQQKHPRLKRTLIRDYETLVSRYRLEGLSFLTKTLPKLGKAIDRSLETGTLEVPREFKRAHGDRSIPAFLQGMISVLFSDEDGQEYKAEVLRDLRQVLYLVYKLELPYSASTENAVIQRFLETEKELEVFDPPRDDILVDARKLVHLILEGVSPLEITPRHGPGAVATGESGDDKWHFSRLYSSITKLFPFHEYFMVGSPQCLMDRLLGIRGLIREDSGCARVVLVPKDSRGPRLISCEPLEFQWIQQGVNQVLVRHLEGFGLTKGQINFQDQSVNASIAEVSSRYGYYATLDLKDASDRVSCDLVNYLFPREWSEVLMSIRSQSTRLPDNQVVTLLKHAPMGSAVCFSVEALCFWAISVAAVRSALNCGYGLAARDTFVYGDDIIVPCRCFDHVVRALELAGLRVNLDKSYRAGAFRESCGVDAYEGINVTPTKVSTPMSVRSSDGSGLASWTAYANDFDRKGYKELARIIRTQLKRVYGILPFKLSNSGYPGFCVTTYDECLRLNKAWGIPSRWNRRYQRVEFRVRVLTSEVYDVKLDGWERLLRNLTQGSGEDPSMGSLPRRTKLVWRWMAP